MNNQSYRHSSSLSSSSSPPHSSSSSSVETPSNNCNNQSTTATTQSHHQPLNSINSSSDQKRRRYRIPRSCDRCRASKIKCVFENGRCSACSLSGVPCTFANPGSLKERPPTQKDVERLQARIRSLERLIHAFSPSLDLKNLPDPEKLLLSQSTTSSSSSSSSSSTSSTSSSLTQSNTLPNLNNQLSTSCRSLSISESSPASSSPIDHQTTIRSPILSRIHQSLNLSDHQLSGSIFTTTHWSHSEPKPLSVKFAGITFNADHYIGVNSIFSLPDSAAPPSGNSCSSAELSPVDKIIRNQYQQRIFGAQHCYPEPDLEEHLLTLYFQKIHPLLPILHLPSFIQLHSSGAALTDASFRSLCLFVFAVASRFSDDPRVMLDVEGKPHQSLQVAGLRYVFSAASHLYRPIATPATLYDLQAYVLLSLYSLGAVSFMTSWSVVGIGLQRAQEAGAHREKSHSWTSNPLRDMLRRKSFFALYEFDHFLSSLVGKTAYMREEDFDLVPLDPDVDVSMGTFINPFLQSDSEAQQTVVDLSRASTAMLTTLGGFRSLLPILNSMHARSDQLGKDANLAESIKSLVNQIDSGMTRWYEQAPERLKKFSIESDSLHLVVCVFFNTWYLEFKLMIYRTLFDYKQDCSSKASSEFSNPTVTPRVANCEDTWMTFCLGLAEQMISLVNMLKSRNLLECGFFWVPSRISAATIVLICSVTREKEVSCPRLDERRKLIELSIEILKDLAPRTYIAQACERAMSKLYQMISSDVLMSSGSSSNLKAGEGGIGRRAPTRNDPNQLLEKSKVEASGIGQKMREEDKPTVGRGVGVSRMNQRLGSNKVPSEIPRHTQAPPPPPPPSQANNPALNQKFRLEAFDLLKVSDATFDFDEYQDFGMLGSSSGGGCDQSMNNNRFDPNNSNNIYSNFTFGSSFGQQ